MEGKKKKAPKKSGTFAENRKLWLAIFSLICYYDDEPLWVVSKTNSKENPMTHTIAVAGKGGVGKTTVCGMMIDYLIKEKRPPCWLWMPMPIPTSMRFWASR
jgi:hypothetical protein